MTSNLLQCRKHDAYSQGLPGELVILDLNDTKIQKVVTNILSSCFH